MVPRACWLSEDTRGHPCVERDPHPGNSFLVSAIPSVIVVVIAPVDAAAPRPVFSRGRTRRPTRRAEDRHAEAHVLTTGTMPDSVAAARFARRGVAGADRVAERVQPGVSVRSDFPPSAGPGPGAGQGFDPVLLILAARPELRRAATRSPTRLGLGRSGCRDRLVYQPEDRVRRV
jgi:hypothetical protein